MTTAFLLKAELDLDAEGLAFRVSCYRRHQLSVVLPFASFPSATVSWAARATSRSPMPWP
jgi:hypothetical protein